MPRTRPNTSASTPLPLPITPSFPQSPTLQPRNPRPSLNMLDLEAGCIVWLPSKDLSSNSSSSSSSSEDKDRKSIKCIRASCCSNTALEEKGYNHPVVVLNTSNYLGDRICLVAIITSQNHNDRLDRLPISQKALSASPHHPTSNSSSNSSTTTTTELYLENSAKMNKQSYILLRHIFQLHALYLRSCSFRPGSRATDTRLREESYARLMSRLCLQRGVWIPTAAAVDEVGAANPGSSPRSRTAEGTRRARRSRPTRGGRRYADVPAPVAVTQRQSLPQPQTPQSTRVERAVHQVPGRSAAAMEAGVSSPVYTSCTHHHPLLGYGAAPSMPGAWGDSGLQVGSGGGGMRSYGYGSASDQGGRFERWWSEPPGGEEEESWGWSYVKGVVVLLAVVGILWWMNVV